MHDLDVRALLHYLVQNGISSCELQCGAAEAFAGAPLILEPSKLTATQLEGLNADMNTALLPLNNWRRSASMQSFEQIRRMYSDQGVQIYAFRLEPVDPAFPDHVFHYAFNAARALGANQVTMEMPGRGSVPSRSFKPHYALTKRIGDIAAGHRIMVGYHAHLEATSTLWDIPIAQSEYNGINLDVGHYVAAGNHDVLAFIRRVHQRITSLHLKDRNFPGRKGRQNEVWGQGDTPLKAILQLMRDERYAFPASIELEYPIPQGSNPVIEVARCVAWAKNVLLSDGPDI
jgi:sugar phosphate isomerase/epimerase